MLTPVIRALGWVVFWLALLLLTFPALAMLAETLDQLPTAAKKSVRLQIEPTLPPADFM